MSSSISVAHELALKKGTVIYPVRCVDCKTFIIAAGNPSLRKDENVCLRNDQQCSIQRGLQEKSLQLSNLYHLVPRNHRQRRRSTLQTFIRFLIRTQIPDISRLTSPCSPVPESYFMMLETTFRVMILRMATPCMLLT